MSFRKSLLRTPIEIQKRLFCNKLPIKSEQGISNTEKIAVGVVICCGVAGGGWGAYDGYKISKQWSYLDSVGYTTCNTLACCGSGLFFPFLLPIILPIGLGIGAIRYMNNYSNRYTEYPRYIAR